MTLCLKQLRFPLHTWSPVTEPGPGSFPEHLVSSGSARAPVESQPRTIEPQLPWRWWSNWRPPDLERTALPPDIWDQSEINLRSIELGSMFVPVTKISRVQDLKRYLRYLSPNLSKIHVAKFFSLSSAWFQDTKINQVPGCNNWPPSCLRKLL